MTRKVEEKKRRNQEDTGVVTRNAPSEQMAAQLYRTKPRQMYKIPSPVPCHVSKGSGNTGISNQY